MGWDAVDHGGWNYGNYRVVWPICVYVRCRPIVRKNRVSGINEGGVSS